MATSISIQKNYKTPTLDEKSTKDIQDKVRSFFNYYQSVDPTMLPDLNEIYAVQLNPTHNKKLATDILLDYDHTYHTTKICYHGRYMIFYVESNAACLIMPGYHSQISGYYYLK